MPRGRLGRVGSDLVVLVVDAEPLSQVSEHHGTVLFELEAAGKVFSGGRGRREHSGYREKYLRPKIF